MYNNTCFMKTEFNSMQVEVIIKLGGCAVTNKNEFEAANIAAIQSAARIVRNIPGKCVVVHGAGSFGHFQAHEYEVHKGIGDDPRRTREGFVRTRLSVTKLSHLITRLFSDCGIPAVSISPCSVWQTSGGQLSRAGVGHVSDLLKAGFVPVMHGDCVIDSTQGCSILSGDKIIERLAADLQPKRVVFLTDVDGIYDRPPSEPGAVLLQKIEIKDNGEPNVTIATSHLQHDTTGGVREKLQSAINIIRSSRGETSVFVARVDSESAYSVCVCGRTAGSETEIVFCPV